VKLELPLSGGHVDGLVDGLSVEPGGTWAGGESDEPSCGRPRRIPVLPRLLPQELNGTDRERLHVHCLIQLG